MFRGTSSRGGHGRRAAVHFVVSLGAAGFISCFLFVLFFSNAHGQVCNNTGQRTPAIYQSYLPDGRNHPAYITHRTRTRTYKNAQNPAAHATIDVRSRHRTNPRSTRFVLDKASECRRRPQSGHMDSLSRRREVAHGVLRSWPKPEQTFFSPKQRSRFLVVCFLHTSRRYTFDLDME